jgi:hypothetical protein
MESLESGSYEKAINIIEIGVMGFFYGKKVIKNIIRYSLFSPLS